MSLTVPHTVDGPIGRPRPLRLALAAATTRAGSGREGVTQGSTRPPPHHRLLSCPPRQCAPCERASSFRRNDAGSVGAIRSMMARVRRTEAGTLIARPSLAAAPSPATSGSRAQASSRRRMPFGGSGRRGRGPRTHPAAGKPASPSSRSTATLTCSPPRQTSPRWRREAIREASSRTGRNRNENTEENAMSKVDCRLGIMGRRWRGPAGAATNSFSATSAHARAAHPSGAVAWRLGQGGSRSRPRSYHQVPTRHLRRRCFRPAAREGLSPARSSLT